MPVALRAKGRATDIAYSILGVPSNLKSQYKKPKKRRKSLQEGIMPEVDDSQVGKRYV